ncbi:BrnT family toxin [candidate division KSB1 bacterium]|nr:BrnT family toxin [candidate division KSB1 bacterium]MBL7095577.1 BrnT family toxin [candidate division KSB1 bacterium]
MKFIWDENKRKTNLQKHGLDFSNAQKVFSGITFTFEDDRFPYYEQRFIAIGMLNSKVVVIAFTERNDTVRIISMRKALKNEKRTYFRGFTN